MLLISFADMAMKTLLILISTSLCLYLLFHLIKILHRFWWVPIRIQNRMLSQGIKGPSYRFPHGSTKELLSMKTEAMNRPMELSHDIFPRVEPHIHSWRNKYGMNFLTWLGPKPQLIVTEPELIREILNNKEGAYPKSDVEGFVKKIFGYGLVTSEGEKWANQRKLAKHAFNAESLKGMIPAIIDSVEMMLERWKDKEGKEIEICEEFRVLTSDVISRTAFGSSYLEGKNIFEMLVSLTSMAVSNLEKVSFFGIRQLLGIHDETESEKLERGIRESIINLVKKREEMVMREELDGFGHDYLGVLVQAYQEEDESKRISLDDVIDEMKTVYIAGNDTSTSLLTWTLLLLAVHTDWQEEARKEVLQIFGQNNPTSYDDCITKLKKMGMILNESLRLYPPVLTIVRKVAEETRLKDVILPSNIELIIPTLPLHHDKEIWGEDVHLFNPERFAQGLTKASKNTNSFLPFGLGPRSCVGTHLATLEVKITLTMILQRYAFTLSQAYAHAPVHFTTNRPQYGVQMLLHPLHAHGST